MDFNSRGQSFLQFEGCQTALRDRTEMAWITPPFNCCGLIFMTVTMKLTLRIREWANGEQMKYSAMEDVRQRNLHGAARSSVLCWFVLSTVQWGISSTKYLFHLLHLYIRLMLNWWMRNSFSILLSSTCSPEWQQLYAAPRWLLPACKSLQWWKLTQKGKKSLSGA